MTTHTERAAKFYGTPAKAAPKSSTVAASPLYPPTKPGQSGTHRAAISNTYDRLETRSGNDAERREYFRTQRRQLEAFLPNTKVDPQTVQELLAVHLEHQEYPRSKEALAQRWQTSAYDAIRIAAGSTEAANAQIAHTNGVLKALEKVAPTLAHDLIANGAAEDPRFIRAAAKIGAAPQSPPKEG